MGLTLSDLAVPADLAGNPWMGVLPKRAKEVLAFSLKVNEMTPQDGKDKKDHKELSAIDVGQRIDRVPKGWDGIVPTLTPRSQIWLVNQGRLLAGVEHLALQGFPMSMLVNSDVPSSQCRDMAGNAFAANVFMSVYIALAAHMPKIEAHQETHDLLALERLQALMSSA